jgi:hypothetical protein
VFLVISVLQGSIVYVDMRMKAQQSNFVSFFTKDVVFILDIKSASAVTLITCSHAHRRHSNKCQLKCFIVY